MGLWSGLRRGEKEAGPNPTDRGKPGYKEHLLVDGRGVPLSTVSTAAHVNDGPLLAHELDSGGASPDLVLLSSCEVGRSSIRTREAVVKLDGSISAEAAAVIVPRDRDAGRSRRITDEERGVLEAQAAATP